MGYGVTEKILSAHIVEGSLETGGELGLRIDQTLTQDATGTMAYLEFEAMDIPRVKTELSVAYVDHNTLQTGFENADDHEFIRSIAKKIGVRYSCPGNGICHQVHLERFGVPGKTLIGSDSHTPTGGGIGMLAIGAGGLDVAVAMGGGLYYIQAPKLLEVRLSGCLNPGVGAKDVILEVLKQLGVKGGVGAILEYTGPGVKTLSVPERATITNMGAELGATSSVFPSDENTRVFLAAQNREECFTEILPDEDATYDKTIEINLSELEPLAACPHMPDNVVSVHELAGIPVNQVCIGSCTNSSLSDLFKVAAALKGRRIKESVSLSVSPGSRQVLTMLAQNGALADILSGGARILECACGPCIGMGLSPSSGAVSLRTFNRNFEGRSGTADAKVYLVSPETAVASALTGVITDPRELFKDISIKLPENFDIDDSMVYLPASEQDAISVKVVKGPNIKDCPKGKAPDGDITARVSIKVGDDITTDHIMPAGAKILPYRSNIPKMSEFCFTRCDPEFPQRAKEYGESFLIGGLNYGQGSSREHAALVPLYLGVRAVFAKTFARIHKDNLVNAGILPLVFCDPNDYDRISLTDTICLDNPADALKNNTVIVARNLSTGDSYSLKAEVSDRQKKILMAGGLLKYTKQQAEGDYENA